MAKRGLLEIYNEINGTNITRRVRAESATGEGDNGLLGPIASANDPTGELTGQRSIRTAQDSGTNAVTQTQKPDYALMTMQNPKGMANALNASLGIEIGPDGKARPSYDSDAYGANLERERNELQTQLDTAMKNRASQSVYVGAANKEQAALQEAEFWDVQITDLSRQVQEKDAEISQWRSNMLQNDMTKRLSSMSPEVKTAVDTLADYSEMRGGAPARDLPIRPNVTNASDVGLYYDEATKSYKNIREVFQSLRDTGLSDDDIFLLTEYTIRQRNQTNAAARREDVAAFAAEHPVVSNIASVLASPTQFLGALELANSQSYVSPYAQADPNAGAFMFTDFVQGVRDQTFKDISEGKYGEGLLGSNVNAFLYQTGMSMADSGLLLLTLGPGSVYLMGANAAASSAQNVLQRGGTTEQAFIVGLASGAAEAIFERIGVERLFKLKSSANIKQFLTNMVKQGGVEASEEMLTEVSNILSDSIVMGERSNFMDAVNAYMANGMSEEDARKQAFLDCVGQVGLAGLGGFISGMGFGAGGTVYQNVQQGRADRQTGKEFLDSLGTDTMARQEALEGIIASGLESRQDSESYKLANKAKGWMRQGDSLSDREVGAMIRANEQALNEEIEAIFRNKDAEVYARRNEDGTVTLPTMEDYDSAKVRRVQMQYAAEMEQKLQQFGIKNVVVTDQLPEGSRGTYVNGTVYLSSKLTSAEAMTETAAHEITHAGQEADANFTKDILAVMDKLDIDTGAQIQAAKDRYTAFFAKNGKTDSIGKVTDKYATEEVVADYIGKLLRSDEALAKFARTDFAGKMQRIVEKLAGKATGRQKHEYTELARRLRTAVAEKTGEDPGEVKQKKAEKNTAEKGGEKRYALEGYSQQQKENWKNSKSIVIFESGAQLRQFIDDALAGKNLQKKMYFGAVSEELAARIKNDTGVDVKGYNCTLRASEVRKILLYSHGNEEFEAARGQRKITPDDLTNIPTIIQSPDKISLDDKPYEGKPVINFTKDMNGRTTVGAYVSGKHLDLTVQTMYAGKNKRNLATGADDQTSADTPEATVGTVPDDNVAQTGENVNARYSIGGENARTADLDALARAKELQKQDVAMDTIYRETGWYTGADGKWRFEIDDSGMEYHRKGDLGFRERHKGYDRYRELTTKAEDFMLGKSDAWLTEDEQKELTQLQGTWSGTFRKDGRVSEDALPQSQLSDYVKHEDLYKAYPQLRKAGLRFAETEDYVRGSYSPETNVITVSESLRNAPEDVLLHEIQHAIQRAEGFTRGSNEEYWREKLERGDQIKTNGYEDAMAALEAFVKNPENAEIIQLDHQLNNAETDEDYDSIYEAAEANGLTERLGEYRELQWEAESQRSRANNSVPSELYRNTAGEIEARDVTARRGMTTEQRRETMPDTGDANTVLTERYSLDADYMDAVERGDMETAQRMVDEAAKRAMPNTKVINEDGSPKIVYHQSKTAFHEFRKGTNDGLSGHGIYFSYQKGGLGKGNVVRAFYLNVENPITRDILYDRQEELQEPVIMGKWVRYEGQIKQTALYDSDEFDGVMIRSDEVVVKDTSQIKSADPVTYDDDGNVIPLSERFNEESDDIRYSVDPAIVDSTGKELTKGQQKYFKDSKARDKNGNLLVLYHGTENGGFTVFDPQFSDDGISLFLSDNIRQAATYSGTMAGIELPEGKPKMLRWTDRTDPTKSTGQKGVYKVYANITKPYVVDAKGRHWNQLVSDAENAVKVELDIIGTPYGVDLQSIENGKRVSYEFDSVEELISHIASDFSKSEAAKIRLAIAKQMESGDGTYRVKTSFDWNHETKSRPVHLKTRDIVKKAKAEKYDGVIFKNIMDSGSHGKGTADELGTVVVVFDSEQIKDVNNANPTKNKDVRYSVDSTGRELSEGQREYFKDSKAKDAMGRLLVLYHQTENEFTVFDPRRGGAGSSDSATPFGIFMKSSAADIGLRGKRQMALYANITSPLVAYTREDLTRKLMELSTEYAEIAAEHKKLDDEYHQKFEEAKQALRNFIIQWRKDNAGASRSALYDVPEFNVLYEAEDAIVEEWTGKADELSRRAKEVITAALLDAKYDGVILSRDTGSFGRSTDAYIALSPEQVKNTDNLNPTEDPDIRYSVGELYEERDAVVQKLGQLQTYSDREALMEQMRRLDEQITQYEERGTVEPWMETETQAQQAGYPVIDGKQVFPYRTWVRDKERGNYGLVIGQASEKAGGGLIVSFWNKDNDKRARVRKYAEDLELITGTYQPSDAELAELFRSEPVEVEREEIGYEDEAEYANWNGVPVANGAAPAVSDQVSALPKKAQNYLRGTERALVDSLGNALSVPSYAKRDFLNDIARSISNEYLQEGRISGETVDKMFEAAYEVGVIADREFYDQYHHVRDYLRSTKITLAEQDRADIADFKLWRKGTFGWLRIVNEGGQGVDTAYMELQDMAPELFPEDITHPADQLEHMFNVAKSIHVVEKHLDEYFGNEAEEFKAWAKNDFAAAVNATLSDLRNVKRYSDERALKAEKEAPVTQEQLAEAFRKMKDARRGVDKAKAKNLLTDHDEVQLGRLLRGEIELQHLDPEKDNVKGITAVYKAKAEYEQQAEIVSRYNRTRKAALYTQAEGFLENSKEWKDKKTGLQYRRETPERNIRDVVRGDDAEAIIDTYITPVHHAAAEANRLKNAYRKRVKELNLSQRIEKGNKVSEAHAVQLYGEAMDNIAHIEASRGRMETKDGKTADEWRSEVQNLWKENPNLDKAKIEGAVAEFRKIYDELFGMMNDTRLRNGYEPANYRRGYFPHFQEDQEDGVLRAFGKALGIRLEVDNLPTDIIGNTHTFKPGIQWFGHVQERLGFDTAYDAVKGFDRYIEGVADVIYQTDNIQRLRAFATQIRYRASDEGIKEQIRKVQDNPTLDDDQKHAEIERITQDGRFELGNLVVWLDEYINLLANKKSISDRNWEHAIGRKYYTVMKNLESRFAANMIVLNPGSYLTNLIPLTQGWSALDTKTMLRGMWDTLRTIKEDDGFAARSDFLTNRRGSDLLSRSWSEKAAGWGGIPMTLIDRFTADTLVRARYTQNKAAGMSDEAAMAEADKWTAGVMADRSKGAMPTLFNEANPVTKLLTQFQLEVNNQFSYLFKDLPKDKKKQGLAALTMALLKFFFGAWLFDEVYEKIVGRRSALDPIGILNDTVGDITGYALPNLVDLGWGAVTGNIPSFETKKPGAYETVKGVFANVAEEIPFVGGLLGGGRIPISSALPDMEKMAKAIFSEDMAPGKRWSVIGSEVLNTVAYTLPPFGGGQGVKIFRGLKAVIEGGSYTINNQGERELQYPVYNDSAMDVIGNAAKATLFGKSSFGTAQDWVESGFDTFNAKETAAYEAIVEAGESTRSAYAFIDSLRGIEGTEAESASYIRRRTLQEADVSDLAKSIAYYSLLATDKERELMNALEDIDADMGRMGSLIMDLYSAQNKAEKLSTIAETDLTDEELLAFVGFALGTELETDSGNPTQYAEYLESVETGLSGSDALRLMADGMDLEDYLKITGAGLESENAEELLRDLEDLEPEIGYKQVRDIQKYMTIALSPIPEIEKRMALAEFMPEGTYAKYSEAREAGIDTYTYIKFLDATNDMANIKNEEGEVVTEKREQVLEYIDSLDLTDEQKDALYYAAGYAASKIDEAPWNGGGKKSSGGLMSYFNG